ncbi:hypothetical protein E4T80_09900 [Muribacter muris]|uniref:Scaffolding protein n=1 Tax=Muribacter muris TaxID=67855 RepID=A0A4Y9JS01_9PAST|nr:hypothetical protein [Muribacter muris]MBF0785771.1 hypothetical protein [Muribacter muris]MBF0828257.1 hypothetical protein [Muribacter muris]TFV08593.1 hypothetical protein E4T80_09900 [Muribacter muris]
MEEITNSTDPHNPYLPAYLRKRLATAKEDTQPSEAEPAVENSQGEVDKDETQTEPTEPSQTGSSEPAKKEEGNEWKGRLRKEQEHHRQTNDRLLAEVEARQRAEAELAELKAKQTASQTAPSKPAPLPTATAEQWSDNELEELSSFIGGELGNKLARYLKGQPQSMPDVNKVVAEKFEQHQAQNAAQLKTQQWQQAVQEQLPDIHGLLQDAQFTDWAYGKEVDYLGNNAMTLISQAGQAQNVALVPKIRALLDEFNQSKQPPQQTTTAPPNKGAAVKTSGAKPKMTAKDIRHKEMLKRQGKTDEMIAFLQKFDHS